MLSERSVNRVLFVQPGDGILNGLDRYRSRSPVGQGNPEQEPLFEVTAMSSQLIDESQNEEVAVTFFL